MCTQYAVYAFNYGDLCIQCSTFDNGVYVKGVLPREVAPAVEVPTTLEATELGRVM